MMTGTQESVAMDVKGHQFEIEHFPGIEDCVKGLSNNSIEYVAIIVQWLGHILVCVDKSPKNPWPGIGIFGGIRQPNEEFTDAASRIIKKKIGLLINPSEFKRICTLNFVLAKGKSDGLDLHIKSTIMKVEISGGKEPELKFDTKRYKDVSFVLFEGILQATDEEGVNPVIQIIVSELMKRSRRGFFRNPDTIFFVEPRS